MWEICVCMSKKKKLIDYKTVGSPPPSPIVTVLFDFESIGVGQKQHSDLAKVTKAAYSHRRETMPALPKYAKRNLFATDY